MFFRVYIFIFVTFLPLIINAQILSVNHFGVDLKNDLSARTNMVKDANGIPCALVKISTLDEITKFEGNVLEQIDKGVEVWVYLSPGTKFLKINTLHHPSLDINFSDYLSGGLKSNTVYKLELKSDLPPNVLFGSLDVSSPMAKEPQNSSILPEWWDINGEGRFVGISYPSYEGETAKRAAILNAIETFSFKERMDVKYFAALDTDNDNEKYQQTYIAMKSGFSVRILQEYYNYKGEYFVLCAIKTDNNTSNRLLIDWCYLDENKRGSLVSQVACEISIRRQPIKIFSTYTCEWNSKTIRYSYIVNNEELMDMEYSKTDCHNSFLNRDVRPLGFEQKQYLSSLPLMPDSLNIKHAISCLDIDGADQIQSYTQIQGEGKSQSREFSFYKADNANVIPMIKEVFPTEIASEYEKSSAKDIEYSGLDRHYLNYESQNIEKAILGRCIYESPMWEVSKNNAFVGALLQANGNYGLTLISSGEDVSTESYGAYNPSENAIKSTLSFSFRVYPLWYLDASLRKKPNKKINKKWESTLKDTDNGVSVLIPISR